MSMTPPKTAWPLLAFSLCILVVSARAAVPEFDEDHAFFLLEAQCAFGPRDPGSEGHRQCLEFLRRELSYWADTVFVQSFTHHSQGRGKTFELTNIIGRTKPERRDRILLCAHWDTRPVADHDPTPENRNTPILGANDGASGVAVLLEIARQCALSPPDVGLDIVLLDGEDYGFDESPDEWLIGSKHFAKDIPLPFPRYGILLDMIGDRDLEIPAEQASYYYAPGIVEKVWTAARDLGISTFQHEVGRSVYDDHIPLNEAGLPTIDIVDFDYAYWHTVRDTPAECSPKSLDDVGRVVLHVIYNEKP
jgi:glutaminyl-peptide cyclotransferase